MRKEIGGGEGGEKQKQNHAREGDRKKKSCKGEVKNKNSCRVN